MNLDFFGEQSFLRHLTAVVHKNIRPIFYVCGKFLQPNPFPTNVFSE